MSAPADKASAYNEACVLQTSCAWVPAGAVAAVYCDYVVAEQKWITAMKRASL